MSTIRLKKENLKTLLLKRPFTCIASLFLFETDWAFFFSFYTKCDFSLASYLTKYWAKCVSWSESKGACVDSQCDVTSWLAWYCSSRLSTKAEGEILRTTLQTCIPRRLWPITDFWNLFLVSQSYFKFSFPMPRIYLKFHDVITTGQLGASLKTAVVEAHIWGICSRYLILSRLITYF